MESILFALSAIVPIILMMAVGYILKRIRMMDQTFAKIANKIVFRVCLPCMLFLNVYKINDLEAINPYFILYPVCTVLAVFLVSVPIMMCVTKESNRRGPLLQVTFRSNYALIGIPLASALFGEKGVAVASLLSAIVIPLFNVLAVISLSIFHAPEKKVSVKNILLDIIKNPLICATVLGIATLGVRMIFVKYGVSFRLSDVTSLYTVLGYLSNIATPLALLVLGAQFEFSAIGSLKREIICGTLARTVFVPLISIGGALLLRAYFDGAHFAAFVALFCTPVAVSSVPMTQEMGGDYLLAGQLVVWTTLVSSVTVFVVSFVLRMIGIF